MYRSVIIKRIRNANLPTNVLKKDTSMSIKEWLTTVLGYQQNALFLHTKQVNNNEIELRHLERNLHIAKKWARHALSHISKVLKPVQYASALTDINALAANSTNAEDWKPPPPPTIQFIPDSRNAWNRKFQKRSIKLIKNKTPNEKMPRRPVTKILTTTLQLQLIHTLNTRRIP
jgi:hypothetical protein